MMKETLRTEIMKLLEEELTIRGLSTEDKNFLIILILKLNKKQVWIIRDELKAEAVKWVKDFRKIRDENRDIHIKNFNYGRIAGLMDFHNITEEDLKNE